MSRLSLLGRSQRLPLIATLVFAVLLALVLAYGMRRASQLQAASSALQSASALAPQPHLITSELTLIQRGLESATYVGDALGNIRDIRANAGTVMSSIAAIIERAGLKGDTAVARALTAVQDRWRSYDTALAALDQARADSLYIDTPSGSQLSESGRALRARVNGLLGIQERAATDLSRQLNTLATALQTAVADMGAELRLLLLAGTLLAAMLIALMLYFAMRARISGSAARQAAHQVESILASVREGLFLVDRDGRIGRAHSASLATLLHTPSPGGHTLQDVLRPMVDEKTQLAAGKYLNLLWNKRVNEDLIESVNPLQQLTVSFAAPGGTQETRYLSFAFHRAVDAADAYLLGSVADITDRVSLQLELEQLKAANATGNASGGSELIMQLLRVDPLQLDSFIASATRAFDNCNSKLKAAGRDETALRDKLDAVFRELHAVKGEAAALGLEGLASRIHAAEDVLAGLRNRTVLVGNDFIPVVTHLDELIRHVSELGTARAQLDSYSHGAAPQPRLQSVPNDAAAPALQRLRSPASVTGNAIDKLLRSLAVEVGKTLDRDVQVRTEGLELVPQDHFARVKDICVQMVRNAVAHGIEPAGERTVAGKLPSGIVKVSFSDSGREEYALVIEDDGQGLSYDRILYRARQLSLVQPDQIALDRGSVFKLIFMPGFSTVEDAHGHAGRGIGLDAVNSLVRECGGRIGIATVPGQFTRFRVILPKAAQTAAAQT